MYVIFPLHYVLYEILLSCLQLDNKYNYDFHFLEVNKYMNKLLNGNKLLVKNLL